MVMYVYMYTIPATVKEDREKETTAASKTTSDHVTRRPSQPGSRGNRQWTGYDAIAHDT